MKFFCKFQTFGHFSFYTPSVLFFFAPFCVRVSLLLAKDMTQERRNGANAELIIFGLVVEFRNHIFGIREIEEIITFSDPMISKYMKIIFKSLLLLSLWKYTAHPASKSISGKTNVAIVERNWKKVKKSVGLFHGYYLPRCHAPEGCSHFA